MEQVVRVLGRCNALDAMDLMHRHGFKIAKMISALTRGIAPGNLDSLGSVTLVRRVSTDGAGITVGQLSSKAVMAYSYWCESV